ncbi:MAG: DUF971 domain-containing protein [Ilumatobacteraceae bacterium]
MSIEPVDIDIVRDRSVTITFDDGVVATYPVTDLRAACPCASCRGWRERGEQAWPRPGGPSTITILHAELSGAWGLSIDWSDGHSTGIYAWTVLRQWWDAGLTGSMVADPIDGAPIDRASGDSPGPGADR